MNFWSIWYAWVEEGSLPVLISHQVDYYGEGCLVSLEALSAQRKSAKSVTFCDDVIEVPPPPTHEGHKELELDTMVDAKKSPTLAAKLEVILLTLPAPVEVADGDSGYATNVIAAFIREELGASEEVGGTLWKVVT